MKKLIGLYNIKKQSAKEIFKDVKKRLEKFKKIRDKEKLKNKN